MGGLGGSSITTLPPPSRPCPPQKFPENNRESNSLLFSNNSLLLKIPPISQPPKENPVTWTQTLQYKECYFSIPIPQIPHSPLCPVPVLENCFKAIPMPNSQPYPLFMFKDGSTLNTVTYHPFVNILRHKLSSLGFNLHLYSGHSFCRGRALSGFLSASSC